MDSTRPSVTVRGPVVVGTDGSDHATRAVRWAAGEAAARGRPLRIVYATGTSHGGLYLSREDIRQIDDFAEGVLEKAAALARRLAPAVPVATVLGEGETTACLLGEAGPDATIVVGSRGRGDSPSCWSVRTRSGWPHARPSRSSSCRAVTTGNRPVSCWPRYGTSTTRKRCVSPPLWQLGKVSR